jgi:topoisomerase-4 subunit A
MKTSNESIDEGFEDIVTSEGKHFYDNHEGENDTITKVTGMYKDWFLDYASYVIQNVRFLRLKTALSPFNAE